MEDTPDSVDKVYEQRLHMFTHELNQAQEGIQEKTRQLDQANEKIKELEKDKSLVQKENRVLNTEIGMSHNADNVVFICLNI